MKIVINETVQAPIDQVFDVFSDISKTEERISEILKIEILSDTTSGKGLRWRETRKMFGKEATEVMEITAFDSPQAYKVEAKSHGMHYISTYSFGETGQNQTNIEMIFEGKPLSLGARLMTPIGLLFKGATKRALQRDITELKKILEA